MKQIAVRFLLVLALAVQLGCGQSYEQPVIGENYTIQFRRDALGTAATLPVAPTTMSINGAETSVYGVLAELNEEWVVILGERSVFWIPRSSVLLIEGTKR